MSHSNSRAPLYVDAYDLCEWLLAQLGDDARVLPRALCQDCLDLLAAITLALKGRDRDDQLERADEVVIVLRGRVRLAESVGCLGESQLVHVLERLDAIGRQLGGWMRSLGAI